ncbi:hypothetical protein G6F32_017118 [Rhizopus arrhizus]|nr:hypothetical protein G6F32_017118 [Rhizopus arrhizus]
MGQQQPARHCLPATAAGSPARHSARRSQPAIAPPDCDRAGAASNGPTRLESRPDWVRARARSMAKLAGH